MTKMEPKILPKKKWNLKLSLSRTHPHAHTHTHTSTQKHCKEVLEYTRGSRTLMIYEEISGIKRLKMLYLVLEYSNSLPVAEKMIRATSASQRTESSSAFLKSPRLLLEKVTCLAVTLSIFLILIFSLAILLSFKDQTHKLNIVRTYISK